MRSLVFALVVAITLLYWQGKITTTAANSLAQLQEEKGQPTATRTKLVQSLSDTKRTEPQVELSSRTTDKNLHMSQGGSYGNNFKADRERAAALARRQRSSLRPVERRDISSNRVTDKHEPSTWLGDRKRSESYGNEQTEFDDASQDATFQQEEQELEEYFEQQELRFNKELDIIRSEWTGNSTGVFRALQEEEEDVDYVVRDRESIRREREERRAHLKRSRRRFDGDDTNNDDDDAISINQRYRSSRHYSSHRGDRMDRYRGATDDTRRRERDARDRERDAARQAARDAATNRYKDLRRPKRKSGREEDTYNGLRKPKTSKNGGRSSKAVRRKSRSSSRSNRVSIVDQDDDDHSGLDQRVQHHLDQVNSRAGILTNRMLKHADKFSEEEQELILQEIDEYVRLEKIVAEGRQQMTEDFAGARNIRDKEERLQYMEEVKIRRDNRKESDKQDRDRAREQFATAREMINNKLQPDL